MITNLHEVLSMNHVQQKGLWTLCFTLLFSITSFAQPDKSALILQEMTWCDVQAYLKTSDMVIIPLGSTEQHGPHMPLGSDCYEAVGISKLISEQTGVLVAPVLWVGYSAYHSGFPGTLSLKPETMEQVLFETVELLIKYGFRRFMFFNYHGGNNVIQDKVIHRINNTTEAIGVAIGHGGPVQAPEEEEFFDWHAGKSETSIMLYLKPELVKMERAEKPEIHFTPKIQRLGELAQKHPELESVWSSLLGVPEETGKGGASHQFSSNGVWSFNHPNTATKDLGEKEVQHMVKKSVKFIKAWQQW